jgi:hypothetical protein
VGTLALMTCTWVIALILICMVLNGLGFLWNLFEVVPLYDEIAHFLTPLVLVVILSEIIYRGGGNDEFFGTQRHAVITGCAIGGVGAVGWEVAEILMDLMGIPAYNPPLDAISDIFLGVLGGAVGGLGCRPLPRPELRTHQKRLGKDREFASCVAPLSGVAL